MKTRKDKRDRIEAALNRKGLRNRIGAIDQGQDGEVILWAGAGYPVRSVKEALALVGKWAGRWGN